MTPARLTLAATVANLMLAACAADGKPEIVSATPAGVEIRCIGLVSCQSPQAVADVAEQHCQKFGLHAQQRAVARAPSGNEDVNFACVRS